MAHCTQPCSPYHSGHNTLHHGLLIKPIVRQLLNLHTCMRRLLKTYSEAVIKTKVRQTIVRQLLKTYSEAVIKNL